MAYPGSIGEPLRFLLDEVDCAPSVPLSILLGPAWARTDLRGPSRAFRGRTPLAGRVLFLMGGRPSGPECRRGDSDAARMANDRVLPQLSADETGAAGAAEQGCQWYAREFCHGWFHNIIQAADETPRGPRSSTARVSRSNGWQWTRVRAGSRRLPLVTAQQCGRPVLSGERRRGPSTDAAQLPLASAVRSSDTHRR